MLAPQLDNVQNVTLEDFHVSLSLSLFFFFVKTASLLFSQVFRINTSVQPNMGTGVYLKSWDGTVNGSPPTGGGGGGGLVKNVTVKNFLLGDVDLPIHLYQTNGGHSSVKLLFRRRHEFKLNHCYQQRHTVLPPVRGLVFREFQRHDRRLHKFVVPSCVFFSVL